MRSFDDTSPTAPQPRPADRRAAVAGRIRRGKLVIAAVAVAVFGALAGLAAAHTSGAAGSSPQQAPPQPAAPSQAPSGDDQRQGLDGNGWQLGPSDGSQPPVGQTRAS